MRYLELKRGNVRLGTLQVIDLDQPWFVCEFVSTPDFEDVKPLFDEELALLEESDTFDIEAWEKAYSRIDDLGLQLVPTDSAAPISEFLLHIDGREARFRY
jgi:hypothetical protein